MISLTYSHPVCPLSLFFSQILSGVYPIAQCSEPYSSILYLAERFPVEAWYGLRMDSGKEGREKDRAERKAWSAWQLCEKFAIKHR